MRKAKDCHLAACYTQQRTFSSGGMVSHKFFEVSVSLETVHISSRHFMTKCIVSLGRTQNRHLDSQVAT